MPGRSRGVDACIRRAPAFARSILERLREAFHAGCPALEERIKCGAPSFEHEDLLGGMVAFQRHVAYGFWKARLMDDPAGLFGAAPGASAMGVWAATSADLPPKRVPVAYVRQTARLDRRGDKEPARARPRGSIRVKVRADLKAALASRAAARKTFEDLPPGARRDYAEWLVEASVPRRASGAWPR